MNSRTCMRAAWLAVLLLPAVAIVLPVAVRGHVDDPYLPEGCGSCHVGHGASNEPMLALSEEDFCYQCHGSDEERTRMIAEGRLSPGARLRDVEREFVKAYRHPVVEGAGHSPTEHLPDFTGKAVAHAECVDCHDPHQRIGAGKSLVHDVSGYTLRGQYVETSLHEYQICLKCHTGRRGPGTTGRSLLQDFALEGRSQHPVTRSASGRSLPSLEGSMAQGTRMLCSDCHRSDDPEAPSGPHGSRHRFLLAGNYDRGIHVDESPFAFELCYVCHDRFSILADESFPHHRMHVEGDPVTGRRGTSCATCHASHGSHDAPHLLDFAPAAVARSSSTFRLDYQQTGERSGECYLECHGHDHGPERY